MSDTFREQLVTRYRAAALRVTKDELHEVMKEYDRLAPDRERERRALALVESLASVERRCLDGCVLQPSCYYLAEGGTTPCEVLRGRCIQLGILPPEEAK